MVYPTLIFQNKTARGVEAEQGGKSKKHYPDSKKNRNRPKETDLATSWRATQTRAPTTQQFIQS